MGNLKTAVLTILGFAAGLTIALAAGRRTIAPPPDQARPDQPPVATPLAASPSIVAPEQAAMVELALDEVADGSLGERGVGDRPEVKTWDDFYEATRILGLTDIDLLRQIVHRLAQELGLTHTDRVHLEQLIITEQLQVTRSALRRYGESIRDFAAAKDAAGEAFWRELRELRQTVRNDFGAQYAARFPSDQMEAINRHLRNAEIRVTEYKNSPTSRFLVSGFGR